jgi:hypothetical protein
MIYCLLMWCLLAEGFLLWVLVELTQEVRHVRSHEGRIDRTWRGPVGRNGELPSGVAQVDF